MRVGSGELRGRSGPDAGRELLAAMYREETGEEIPPILVTDRGKPYFAQGDWHFSISHTRRHAFCVLAKVPVGIDAEELDRKIRPELAAKILSPNEMYRYDGAQDKQRALLTFWVLKEAAAKQTGEGLRGYPNHTDFCLEDSRVREMDGCLVAVIR